MIEIRQQTGEFVWDIDQIFSQMNKCF